VGLRLPHCVFEDRVFEGRVFCRQPERQRRGHGTGKGATRSVQRRPASWAVRQSHYACRGGEYVYRVAGQVPPLDHHRPGPARQQDLGGSLGLVEIIDL
jgi:hypothetical protein